MNSAIPEWLFEAYTQQATQLNLCCFCPKGQISAFQFYYLLMVGCFVLFLRKQTRIPHTNFKSDSVRSAHMMHIPNDERCSIPLTDTVLPSDFAILLMS